jgi:hypothetical protein
VPASPSTSHIFGPSQDAYEKRTKHGDDLANAKLIPSILPNYILPLAGAVNRDSIPRDFKYTLATMYLPKGIQIGKPQLDKIMTLKINEFKLGDSKNFEMLYPHRYMNSKKEKKSKIIP